MVVILETIQAIINGVASLFNKVWDFIGGIPAFFERFIKWVIAYLKEFPIVVFDSFMSAVADVLNSIFELMPLEFIGTFLDYGLVSSSSSYIAYIIEPFRVGYGLGLIVSAYVIRFFIRRLPVIG